MSIGSAFDAYVKSFIHERLFGKTDPTYELRTLFEKQVEEQHWDWAWVNGAECFRMYRESGALADMLLDLNAAIGEPKFEIEVRGTISARSETVSGSVVLLGKPDVYFLNKLGNPVILDWKVNGWCSKSGASPKNGYIRLRHGSKQRSKDKTHHRDCHPMVHQGMMINVGRNLERIDKDWATQLCIYGWLCGMEVGSDFLVGLDQLVCTPSTGPFPEMRVAEHRTRVGKTHQWEIFQRAVELWEICKSGHVFRELSEEESRTKCEFLDAKAKALTDLNSSEDEIDKAFLDITRDRW